MYVKGVNLGNWLVLEKWMSPALYEGTTARDEYDLPRQLPRGEYEARIKTHRLEYISEGDFVRIRSMGLNTVRIPVPFFIFGDVEPYIGCVEELDKAFRWAERYGLQILIDLHTVPGGQNGFDNGGISGICTWAQDPDKVEFTLHVLERLAERYGSRPGLFGIQPVNEPISEEMWDRLELQKRYIPADSEMGKKSCGVPKDFLRRFYVDAYRRIRRHMAAEKAVVLHDGFELLYWKDFMREEEFQNVWLDTHHYLTTAEAMGCAQALPDYLAYIKDNCGAQIREMEQYFPVICGEWCLFTSLVSRGRDRISDEEKAGICRALADAQLEAWRGGHGYCFWSYKLLADTVNEPDQAGRDAWDLGRSYDSGWFPKQ